MTDLSPYIKQLLYRNDCVIIPAFGGIMAQYASAQVHPIQNVFTPPYKSLAFNKSLVHNDGLLISEIVRYTGVSYDAAAISIHQYVRKLENDLSGKGQASISGVGKFYYDIEHNLLFESFEENNYLINAFGFDRFVAKPIMRREEVVHQLANEPTKKKSRSRFGWAGFGVLLALIVIAFQIINVSNDFKPINLNGTNFWNSINSLFSSDKNENNSKPIEVAPSHRKDTLVQIIVYQSPNESTEKANTIDTSSSIAPEADSTIIPASTNSPSENYSSISPTIASAISYAISLTQNNELKYFVVFACLKSQNKADLFINQMKKKGIDVKVLIQDTYFRIGKGSFNSPEEAVDSMRQYRSNGIADVWVMKR